MMHFFQINIPFERVKNFMNIKYRQD